MIQNLNDLKLMHPSIAVAMWLIHDQIAVAGHDHSMTVEIANTLGFKIQLGLFLMRN